AIVVLELQAERHIEPKPEGDILVHGKRKISRGNAVPATSIASLIAQRLAQGGLRVGIVKLRADIDAADDDQRFTTIQMHQPRRIVENRRGIVRGRSGSRESSAESAGALLQQCESGTLSGRCGDQRSHAYRD